MYVIEKLNPRGIFPDAKEGGGIRTNIDIVVSVISLRGVTEAAKMLVEAGADRGMLNSFVGIGLRDLSVLPVWLPVWVFLSFLPYMMLPKH